MPKRKLFGLGWPKDANRIDVLPTAGGAVLLAAILTASSVFTRHVLPILQALVPCVGILDALFKMAGYLALAVVSYFCPRAFASSGLRLAGLCVLPCAAVLLFFASAPGNPVLCLVGALLYGIFYAWVTFLFACRLIHLSSIREAAVTVVGGIVACQFLLPLYSLPLGFAGGLATVVALLLFATVLLAHLDGALFTSFASKESLDILELTNPLSSLRPPNLLFFATFLVPFAYNFLSVFGIPGLSARRLIVVFLMFVLLYLLLIQREGQEDRLFSLTVVFIMAGLLIAPLQLLGDNFMSHTFLFLGSSCFDTLLWLLMYSLGRRNVVAMMFFFGVAESLGALGRVAGVGLGKHALSLVDSNLHGTQSIMLYLALAFFLFVWLGFKRFSFTRAIRGVEAIETTEAIRTAGRAGVMETSGTAGVEVPQTESQSERHAQRCRELTARGSLTPRETEVFELLVRGRNARFIMEDLHITRNTAKAHIAHIYTKLGVHSHQELLSLVENEEKS